jgi:uncharacterized membrane protein YphA (DoxX/SURF4 family)
MLARSERRKRQMRTFSSVLVRLAVGLSFLSAVADRLGWWGPFGHANVAWGSFARFVAYTARLNWFLPQAMIPPLAILSTVVEALLGLLLVVGWQTRIAAACSGLVLIAFGLAMTAALGPEAPLSFSVFSAAGGSLLLATCSSFPYSLDELLGRPAMPSARRSATRVTS